MTMAFSLAEKCKLAVWMEQFQSAEIVQLRFRKEFSKAPPSLATIEGIHCLFMTTGSVSENEYSKAMSQKNMHAVKKINSSLKPNSNFKELLISDITKSEDGFSEENDEDDKHFIDKFFSHKEMESDNMTDFVAILREDESVSDVSITEKDKSFTLSSSEKSSFADVETTFEAHQKTHSLRDFFRCSLCPFTSNSTSQFRVHRKNCGFNIYKGLNKEPSKNNSLANKLDVVSNNDVYTCGKCGKAYSSVASLKMHEAYHSKLRPFSCNKCDYRFLSENTLKKHLITHEKIKHLECPYCSFTCNMSGNMIIHARTHTGEKPYKCPECPYKTGNPSTIKQHLETHRNENAYKCTKCNYKTQKKSLLLSHVKSHDSDGLKLKCHICNEVLRNAYAFKYHLTKQHTQQEQLECPFCDYCQNNINLLKIHIRRHTGERPYACPDNRCSFRAMRSQDLKKHLVVAH